MTDSVNKDYLAGFLRVTANKPVTQQLSVDGQNEVQVVITIEQPAQAAPITAVLRCTLSSDGKTVEVSTTSARANEVSITDISLETPASLVGPTWVNAQSWVYSGIFCGGSMGDVKVLPYIDKRDVSEPENDAICICTKTDESASSAITTIGRGGESSSSMAASLYEQNVDVYAVKIGDYDDYADDAARVSAILAYFD